MLLRTHSVKQGLQVLQMLRALRRKMRVTGRRGMTWWSRDVVAGGVANVAVLICMICIFKSVGCVRLYVLYVCLYVCLSIYLSVSAAVSMCLILFTCLSMCISVCLFMCLYFVVNVHVYVCLSVHVHT